MTALRLLFTGLIITALTNPAAKGQTLDLSFAPPTVYASGTVYSVTEQPDGKLLAVGNFTRLNGVTVARIVRFDANGVLDAAFSANVGTSSPVYRARRESTGKYLLAGFSNVPLMAGGLTRPGGLLRLNTDGTADASFDVGTGPNHVGGYSSIDDMLPLANGQTIAVGYFDQFSGTTAHHLVRLNANGTVDLTFNQGAGADDEITTVAPTAGGKLLIGGYFARYNNIPCNGLARLNADGSLDTSFNANLQTNSQISNIKVQPDGRILLAGNIITPATASNPVGLLRVLADGATDNSYLAYSAQLNPNTVYSFYGEALEVQPNGQILAKTMTGTGSVMRLNQNGSVDQSYVVANDQNYSPLSITLLSNNQLLVAGSFSSFGGLKDRTLVRLTANGTLDDTFQPVLQTPGSINALTRQPDGKLLIGGTFTELNGQPARRLARLNADGTVDGTFTANVGSELNLPVNELALQANGSLLALYSGGALSSTSGNTLRRYLASGIPDNSFPVFSFGGQQARVLVQPDDRILVGGSFMNNSGTGTTGVVRLTSNGAYDPSFALSPTLGVNSLATFQHMALQPDGKLLVGGLFRPTSGSSVLRVVRYTAGGAPDPTFTSNAFTTASGTSTFNQRFTALALQPDGKLLAGGTFGVVNGINRTNLARLNTDGSLDATFLPPPPTGTISSLAVQPNSRILVGGSFTAPGLPSNLARLLPDGTADATFAATAVPNSTVRTVLPLPDGTLMISGAFTVLSGQPITGLARLMAPNVLHVRAPQTIADRTEVWPVPAHTKLHVATAPAVRAQAIDLLNALGQTVRHVVPDRTAAIVTVPLETLPAGSYVLRVTYAEGVVARRVQVQ
jgi:uncharacterized delta-60 repeat protein